MDDDARIVAAEEVPADSTLLVTLRPGPDAEVMPADGGTEADPEVEVMLTRLGDDSVVAFRNYCQHWTDVRLDKGDGAYVRNEEIFCQKHGATFEKDGGYCNFGPCEGSSLETVAVEVVDGDVVLTDDDYEFLRVGAAERDDSAGDSRIDFTGN
ncbi:Rieske (2Fe-2S) protein [Haloparvum sp. PAK95]|uniref:Rieske (2Fe-2S) protein n=1 Tax=Haloparvum sp. PAK95 TaxID=3418962 RepID=UPI003D2EC393